MRGPTISQERKMGVGRVTVAWNLDFTSHPCKTLNATTSGPKGSLTMKQALRLKENEQRALRELKERLSRDVNLRALYLFGSKAKGDDSPDSDIDIMIEIEEYTPEIESTIDDIIFQVNLHYDVFISATIFDRKELEDGPMSQSPLYKSIERDGVGL